MSLRFGTVSSRAFASLSKECSIPYRKKERVPEFIYPPTKNEVYTHFADAGRDGNGY